MSFSFADALLNFDKCNSDGIDCEQDLFRNSPSMKEYGGKTVGEIAPADNCEAANQGFCVRCLENRNHRGVPRRGEKSVVTTHYTADLPDENQSKRGLCDKCVRTGWIMCRICLFYGREDRCRDRENIPHDRCRQIAMALRIDDHFSCIKCNVPLLDGVKHGCPLFPMQRQKNAQIIDPDEWNRTFETDGVDAGVTVDTGAMV